jgi:transglutaminase-like putative cysteine protease
MTRFRLQWPATLVVSLLAALTSWLTMLSWAGFAERPSGYLEPLFFICLVVAVLGALLRSARLPAVVVLLGQLAVVVLVGNHLWGGGHAALGWLPTPTSLDHSMTMVRHSIEVSQTYLSPVPRTLTSYNPWSILVGSLCVVLIDFLACGLHRVALAGLPLLAMFTVPVSMLDGGVSWLKFLLPAICFIFLIAGEESIRLSHWGRDLAGSGEMSDSARTLVTGHAVWPSARKIGLTATGLAVVAPILVPTLHVTLFDGDGSGPGDGDSVSIHNPIIDLKRDLTQGPDVPLVTVTTSDPDPSYLRLSVLDAFNGDTWSPSGRDIPVSHRADGALPNPVGLAADVATLSHAYRISVADSFDSTWLPTPFPAEIVDAAGDWRYDTSTMDFISWAKGQTTAGLRYDATSLTAEPTVAQLVNAGPAPTELYKRYTVVPAKVPDWLRRMAQDVTRGADSPFARAVKLQDFFRSTGGFTYSTDRQPGSSIDQLSDFLRKDRTGYCEQFAASMALMGRIVGIPSRVAIGFLRPQNVARDTWVYSTRDLHAWPELYFEHAGWVRFEPTPATRTGGAPGYTIQTLPEQTIQPSASSSAPVPTRNPALDESASPNALGGASNGGNGGRAGWLLPVGLTLLALLAVAATPRAARSVVRRRRWSAARTPAALAEAAWAELRASAIDLRLPWSDSVTLRTLARELVGYFGRRPDPSDDALARHPHGEGTNPEATAAVQRIVLLVERARYARSPADPGDVRTDVETCVEALHSAASRRRRLLAGWLPTSLWTGGPRRAARSNRRLALSEPGLDRST